MRSGRTGCAGRARGTGACGRRASRTGRADALHPARGRAAPAQGVRSCVRVRRHRAGPGRGRRRHRSRTGRASVEVKES
ncbi:hypothetical protein SLNWT_1034 [Streptomyces albus]|uniref:Uncharacterized protein n=1 Tax=Streptomyces albus (strain ATCC 21838 / DSM 41398 / FERM P-419 / JCM 4703 / NBRC 107858) TaxID=1081613 RepID=A0A0B5EQ54_STRA4|nr:hypothetical protein SLNWT_1034 [Streptomyces albus]AOU75726.1 hypothetical protein SLNHY_1035 [Streptomyces albus]